ncbi:MAG: hypothetical protein ABR591_15485 [Candidatus Velthaea sp.]
MASAPAFAANPTGAVKMTWNVAATATMTLATNYTTAANAPQSLGATSLQGSPAATCASGASETALNLTFGALSGSTTVETACNYQRAVSALVVTNDALGYKVQEWLDTAPTAGIQFCAFPNGSSATVGPASSNATAPAAIAAGACATGGSLLPAGSAPTGAGAGQPGTAGIRNSTAPATPFTWANVAAGPPAAQTIYGEDIQINLAPNQASSTADSSYIIISLIPN